ncbi:MAG: sensor histidine kinase [Luteibaculaceae bacterium]
MNIKKTYILFYVLAGYVTLQFVWWAYLLVDLNIQIADLQDAVFPNLENNSSSSFEKQANRRIWMIVGEGSVFLILLLIGYEAIRRSIAKQFSLALQQNNFLLSVTHELKTPIAAVKLLLQTTQKHNLPQEKQDDLIRRALRDTERLGELTENILLATRLEQQAYGVNLQPVNLQEWFLDFVEHHKERNQHQCSLIFNNTAQEEIYIDADLMALESIFGNIIENAIKYGDTSKPIEINITQEREGEICVSIKNYGEPINENEIKEVFKKFYRSGNEQTRKTKGTGLGLYIVKKLTDLHKGKVRVYAAGSNATLFKISLPVLVNAPTETV